MKKKLILEFFYNIENASYLKRLLFLKDVAENLRNRMRPETVDSFIDESNGTL